jgi:hypothetical protein
MSRIARAAVAFLALAALGGGLVLPAVGLVLADEPAAFCGATGRCCCADPAAGADERPCLRRGCGCEQRDAVVAGAPIGFEAVLPAASRLALPGPLPLDGSPTPERPLARPHAPPVPPPKRPLPA